MSRMLSGESFPVVSRRAVCIDEGRSYVIRPISVAVAAAGRARSDESRLRESR